MYLVSVKVCQEMMDNILVYEKVMQGVYGSYVELLQEIREKDVEIQKDFVNRYGIDMKEIFEEFYVVGSGGDVLLEGDKFLEILKEDDENLLGQIRLLIYFCCCFVLLLLKW